MFVRLSLAFLFLSVGALRADDNPREQLQGTWVLTGVVKDGKNALDDQMKGARIRIEGNRITSLDKTDKEDYTATFTVDAKQTPKAIDMKIVSGKEQGKTAKGIWLVDKNTLKLCYSFDQGARPKDFEPAAKEGHILLVMERDKKK